jgi:[Skp1-protein]-hydroxyproline N-acetylglucosaminyltransferase
MYMMSGQIWLPLGVLFVCIWYGYYAKGRAKIEEGFSSFVPSDSQAHERERERERLKEEDATIFISIPSFRDVLCNQTIESAISNAKHPERLAFGVYEQNDDPSETCVKDNVEKVRGRAKIRVRTVPSKEARGPTKARSQCFQLYKGEDVYVQIDSHSKFAKDWDVRAVKMLNGMPVALDRGVISSHPINTHIENWDTYDHSPVVKNVRIDDNGDFVFWGDLVKLKAGEDDYAPSRTIGAGFMLAHRSVMEQVPIDPNLDGVFWGEELLYTARLYTRGIDVYGVPADGNIVGHVYGYEGHKVPWDDKTFSWVENNDGRDRVKALLTGELKDEVYGMGEERTLAQFWDYVGLDYEGKKITIEEDWKPPHLR